MRKEKSSFKCKNIQRIFFCEIPDSWTGLRNEQSLDWTAKLKKTGFLAPKFKSNFLLYFSDYESTLGAKIQIHIFDFCAKIQINFLYIFGAKNQRYFLYIYARKFNFIFAQKLKRFVLLVYFCLHFSWLLFRWAFNVEFCTKVMPQWLHK